MNNSIGCFEAAWFFIWNLIKNSLIYKFLKAVYGGISDAWRKSRIAGWFRRLHTEEGALEKTVAGKIVRCPFTFLEFLQKKFGKRLAEAIENSSVLELCREYLNNLLAINLRFIGYLLFVTSAGLILGQMAGHQKVGWVLLGGAALGAVLTFFDVNVTDYLKGSAAAGLICRLLGIESDFNWYDERYTKGKERLLSAVFFGAAAGLLGGWVNPLLAPALIIGFAAVFLVLKFPSAGVFFVVFAAPVAPTMADVGLALLSIFSLALYSVTHKGFKFKFDGIGFFIIVFLGVYAVAAVTSFAMMNSFSIWAIYFVFISIYFVIINTVNTKKLLMNLLTVFVLSGFLVCLYGVAQYVFGWDTAQAWMDEEMFSDIKMRIYSTLGNPNVLGEYILLVLPASVGLMWVNKRFEAKVVYAAVSALMFGALILTFSRGCWIGIMAAAAIFITFAAGKLWGLGLIALPIIPMILPQSIINRFSSIGNMEDSSTSYRVYIWMGTLAMIKDFWLSGIGMGQKAFTQVYPFYSYNGIVAPHSHNLFLQILVESGIVGIAVFLIIAVLFLRRVMTGYQAGGKGDSLSTIMTALSAGVCGFLLQGMFDNCFYNYRVMLVFWCVLAMGRACVYVAEQKRGTAEI